MSSYLDAALAKMDAARAMFDRHDYERRFDAGRFEEQKHPRERGGPGGGQFTSKGGGGTSTKEEKAQKTTSGREGHKNVKSENGERTTETGEPLPPHIQALKIPPAWTDVTYSDDPKAKVLATGKDAKGRLQAIYSKEHHDKQAVVKFARIQQLDKQFNTILNKNKEAQQSTDAKVKDTADCFSLIMHTGIRPGSEDDTGAKRKAYGASTLLGRHVLMDENGGVELHFEAKSGKDLVIPVNDSSLSKMLIQRKERVGDTGQLFNISDKDLRNHMHQFGEFKTKDLRTLLGTKTAMGEVDKHPPPKDEKEYKKAVADIAKIVSKKLGNTPLIALQSYIAPVVFSQWKQQLGQAA